MIAPEFLTAARAPTCRTVGPDPARHGQDGAESLLVFGGMFAALPDLSMWILPRVRPA
jgi:hypothetical protein